MFRNDIGASLCQHLDERRNANYLVNNVTDLDSLLL